MSMSHWRSGEAELWKDFSHDYAAKVFSVTSFPERRSKLTSEILPGVVIDDGCGPLGLMLSEICRRPATRAIGIDVCQEMIAESRRNTAGYSVSYVVADHHRLPFRGGEIDCIVAINSFLPPTRPEVETIFAEVVRVLRKGGRLVALLPSFEMSLLARDRWCMALKLDLIDHREWDTTGWQCYYTRDDIDALIRRHGFRNHKIESMTFSAPEEITHISEVYAASLPPIRAAQLKLEDNPLFEHLLVAER